MSNENSGWKKSAAISSLDKIRIMWTQSNRNQYHRGTNFDKKYIHKEPSIIHSYGIPNSACYSRKMACLIGSLKKEPPTNNTVASGDRKEEGKCVHLYWFYWCQAGSVGYTIWHEHFARLADPTPPFTRSKDDFPVETRILRHRGHDDTCFCVWFSSARHGTDLRHIP